VQARQQAQSSSRCLPACPPACLLDGHTYGLHVGACLHAADRAWRQLLEDDMRISLKQLLLPANKKLLREVCMLCIAVHAVTTGVCSSVDIQRSHGQLCGHRCFKQVVCECVAFWGLWLAVCSAHPQTHTRA
jgi:hypothetical protein